MKTNRRDFLKTLGGIAAFTIVPRHVLGNGFIAPSDQLTKGIIGTGGMGRGHVNYAGTRLVAVCDVDKNHLELGKQLVKEKIAAYHDFRDLILDPNVDIVHIATPPHWHGIMSVEAAKAGKDIWCEKPMTRTIGEGKRVMEAVKQYGRMFRLNTWFRFADPFYGLGTPVKPLKKLVQSGLLGWPLKVTISKHTGFDWKFYWVGKEYLEPQPVPKELDYDFWLDRMRRFAGSELQLSSMVITPELPEDAVIRKVLYVTEHKELEDVREALKGRFDVVDNTVGLPSDMMGEIVLPSITKASGIDRIIEHYGDDISRTVAIGDGANDIEMVEHAGLGIAMGNADDCLKEAAAWIAPPIMEDGLAAAIRYALNLMEN